MTDVRILLVDDEPLILSSLSRRLKGRFEIKTAGDGTEAVAIIEEAMRAEEPFAVVLCDMHMPGMDGVQTLARIHALAPDTIGIMLTGDADQQTAITAINQGNIFRFYVKPVDSALLAEGIAAAARQYELLRAEHRLAENEERWRIALEAVGDGVWDWDTTTNQLICSESWRRKQGIAETPPQTIETLWWSLVHPDDTETVFAAIHDLQHGERATLYNEHRQRGADGAYRWILARGAVFSRDRAGAPTRLVGTFTDITDRKLMEEALSRQTEELRILATTDALTGLANRRHFLDKAEQETQRAARYGRALSLVMIDIDFFKHVNDTHGHDGGDAVLRQFAKTLNSGLRKTDMLGRLGGEEFALLLPETDSAGAFTSADTLRRNVAASAVMLADGHSITITASFGIASMTSPNDTVADLLKKADEALYEAKQTGRNKVCCHAVLA